MRILDRFRRPLPLAVLSAVLGLTLAAPPAYATATARMSPADLDHHLPYLHVSDLTRLLDAGRTTSADLTAAYLRRIAGHNGDHDHGINAIIAENPDAAREAARLDRERRAGHVRGPLHGVPIVIKDNTDLAGMPTTSGSTSLAALYPPDDATQVRRLRAAGAVIIAKTNMHEFAYGITTISSLGGQTRNPYDLTRNPGGSSGGTGAAVTSGFAAAGMGTDTCGSIRIPSAHNDLVGLRPTLGLSSRDGVTPMSDTQDTLGPLGTSVRDVATMLDATVAYDPKDPVTARGDGHRPAGYATALRPGALRGARIGLFTDLLGSSPAERPTTGVIDHAVTELRRAGATVVPVHRPDLVTEADASDVIPYEFERDLNRYLASPGMRVPAALARLRAPYDRVTLADIVASGQVTPSVMTIIKALVGTTGASPEKYGAALTQRARLQKGLDGLLSGRRLDALAYPTLKEQAAPIGEEQKGSNCALSAHSGFPALTVPAGFTPQGMPVGLELLGRRFAEPTLLGLGYAYERATDHRRVPAV